MAHAVPQALQARLLALSRTLASLQNLAVSVASTLRTWGDDPGSEHSGRSGSNRDGGNRGSQEQSFNSNVGGVEAAVRRLDDWAVAAEALGGGPAEERPVTQAMRLNKTIGDARSVRHNASGALQQLEKTVSKDLKIMGRRLREGVYAQVLFDIYAILPLIRDLWERLCRAWEAVDNDASELVLQEQQRQGPAVADPSSGRGSWRRFFASPRKVDHIVTRAEIDNDIEAMDSIEQAVIRLAGLVSQASNFVQLRRSLNTVYDEHLACRSEERNVMSRAAPLPADASRVLPDYTRIFRTLQTLVDRTRDTITHDDLVPLVDHLCFELDALQAVVDLQIQVSQLQFMTAILAVVRVQGAIGAWRTFLGKQSGGIATIDTSDAESRSNAESSVKTGLSGENGTDHEPLSTPALNFISWVFSLINGKLCLYFHSVLLQQETLMGGDAASFSALALRSRVNFPQVIDNFVSRSDAVNFSILVDLATVGKPIQTSGYVCLPRRDSEAQWTAPGGTAGWPAIFSRPTSPPIAKHWPNLLSTIFRNSEFLDAFREPLVFFDSAVECTYFCSQIERGVYIVLIFEKRKDTDTSSKEFLVNVAGALRLTPARATLFQV